MVRSELIAKIVEENPHLTLVDATKVVDTIFNAIGDTVAAGNRVELRGFGTFTLKTLNAKIGRNPRNGDPVDIPAKSRMWFRAGKGLNDRLNAGSHSTSD